MKKIKKILYVVFVTMFMASCASITSKDYFEKGDYAAALRLAATEITKVKKEEDREVLISRIRQITTIFENRVEFAKDDFSKSEAYFEIWRAVYAIEQNPILEQYTNLRSKYNSYESLSNSVEYMKRYARYNENRGLMTLIDKFKKNNVQNTGYASIYQSYAKYVADIYYDKASFFERNGKLEEARDYYLKTNDIYKEFEKNYRGSYNRYYAITKNIELLKANKLVEEANSYYVSSDKERAAYKYKEALRIYEKFNETHKARNIRKILEKLDREVDYAKANKNFLEGVNDYERNRYTSAKYNFEKALSIYKKYSDSSYIRQINLYLENINNKLKVENADEYFNRGVRYYNSGEYSYAKEIFLKARELYRAYGSRDKVQQIDVYLENIKLKLGFNGGSNRNKGYEVVNRLYVSAQKDYQEAERITNINSALRYYNSALVKFKKMLNYNLTYDMRNEVEEYIKHINNRIIEKGYIGNNNNSNRINDIYYSAQKDYQRAESISDIDTAIIYYNNALTKFKSTLNYNLTYDMRNEVEEYIKYINKRITERLYNGDNSRYAIHIEKAKEFLKRAESEISTFNIRSHYRKAIEHYKEALKYTNDYSKKVYIENEIIEIERKLRYY
ncbi:hypothetical protein [Oceanivirga salmonicida]|uniref:hypothetical protein n=1 Tax=Oceanivirga salmonicida TaxID=1769291 RepID=UPI0012E32B8C|nr:hypothetical protein [Oceanivirga salmonicida]